MNTYVVRRIIDGIPFHKDEDRMQANSWEDAEQMLPDSSCSIVGQLVDEIPISTDEMLDIMNKYDRILVTHMCIRGEVLKEIMYHIFRKDIESLRKYMAREYKTTVDKIRFIYEHG